MHKVRSVVHGLGSDRFSLYSRVGEMKKYESHGLKNCSKKLRCHSAGW